MITYSIETSRELEEESGLKADELEQAGILKFEFVGEPQILEVHVFRVEKYQGSPGESEGEWSFWVRPNQSHFGGAGGGGVGVKFKGK